MLFLNRQIRVFVLSGKGLSGFLTDKQGQAASGSEKNLPAALLKNPARVALVRWILDATMIAIVTWGIANRDHQLSREGLYK